MRYPKGLNLPWEGINLWVPRFQYCAALLILGVLVIGMHQNVSLLLCGVSVCALVFEGFVYHQLKIKRVIYQEGQVTDSIVTAKNVTLRGSINKLLLQYCINGRNIQSEGAVSDSIYFKIAVGDHLKIIVHPKKSEYWLPHGLQ